MKRLTLWYLASYLLFGGVAFTFFPALALMLFLSNGDYDEVMPRLAGMFMIMLGGFVATMVTRRDYSYYRYSILARTFAVVFLLYLFFSAQDPMFALLTVVVLIGLLPSMYVAYSERKS